MAHIYSAKAPHLNTLNFIRYRPGPVSSTLLALFSAVFSLVFVLLISGELTSSAKLFLFFAVCIISFNIFREFYIVYRRHDSRRFVLPSRRYEDAVLGQLARLPDQFSVFHRIELPDNSSIHVVVTSPEAIFAIRVKRKLGLIGFDGNELTHNGYPMNDGDLIYQTVRHAQGLQEYLKKNLEEEVTVKPVLVFTADTIVTQLTSTEMKGVHVVLEPHLENYLARGSFFRSKINLAKVNQILLSLLVK